MKSRQRIASPLYGVHTNVADRVFIFVEGGLDPYIYVRFVANL